MPEAPPFSLFDSTPADLPVAGQPAAGRGGLGAARVVAAPFADGKAADALRTIGEVASALGIRQHVLRYWEEQFPMLRPLKRSGSRRYYRPADIALVQLIDRLVHHEGYTLRGARLAIEGRGAEAVAERTEPVAASPAPASAGGAHLVDRLKHIRARLASAGG
ncbi:MerR family transcriptional regulator [Novosphingobium bradum]|uniref:MerR family transcriptional regulator n=1 Tax=Novosphingobium bradum TaxID=1737444 RepID=A0ABV7IU09_9SPHN